MTKLLFLTVDCSNIKSKKKGPQNHLYSAQTILYFFWKLL